MEMLAQIEQHIANGDRCITAQLDMIGYARSELRASSARSGLLFGVQRLWCEK
jgi:hypothetical protein